jgi:hypothetical protein
LQTNIVVNGAFAATNFVFSSETPQGELLWQTSLPATNQAFFSETSSTSSYSSSNSPLYFVAHGFDVTFSSNSFLVTSISPDGQFNWIRNLESIAPPGSFPSYSPYIPAIIADRSGNIYLRGMFAPLGGTAPRRTNAFGLTKLDPSGRVLWTSAPENPTNAVAGIWAFDQDDNIILAGVTGDRWNPNFIISKLDSEGVPIRTSLQGADSNPGGFNYVDSITPGPSGVVVLNYGYWGMETGPFGSLLELGPDGKKRWSFYTGPGQQRQLAFDSEGDVYVAFGTGFYEQSIYHQQLVILKYAPVGSLLWRMVTPLEQAGFPVGQGPVLPPGALQISSNGEVIVSGNYSLDGGRTQGVRLLYVQNKKDGLPVVLNRAFNYFSPILSSPPQRIADNRPFTIDVPVGGEEPLAFQWLLNGVPIAGATNHILSFPNTQPSDSGIYSLFVSNRVGCALSDDVNLQVVHVEPTFLTAQGIVVTGTTNRSISLDLRGNPSQWCDIELSTNLIQWNYGSQALIGPNGSAKGILLPLDPAASQQFFRLKFYP